MNKKVIAPYVPDLSAAWLVEPRYGKVMYRMLEKFENNGFDLKSIYPDLKIEHGDSGTIHDHFTRWYEGNTAVVTVSGTMLRKEPPSSLVGEGRVITYPQLTGVLSDLVANDDCERIVLRFTTYGGSSAGLIQCMDSIAAAQQRKPVIGFIDDYCCSAGYFLVSQCSEIIASEGAVIGSIGAYVVLVDSSEYYEEQGIKWILVSSAPLKGAGADGKVSDAHIKEVQREIDELMVELSSRVKAGRGLTDDQMKAMATGQVYHPPTAQEMLMIDKITNFHDFVDIQTESKGATKMADDKAREDLAVLRRQVEALQAAQSETASQLQKVEAERDALEAERDEARSTAQALEEENTRRDTEYRHHSCKNWVNGLISSGEILPKAAPRLLGCMNELSKVRGKLTVSYTDTDGSQKSMTGELYEIVSETLNHALERPEGIQSSVDMEMAESRIHPSAEAALEAGANPLLDRMKERGKAVNDNSDLPDADTLPTGGSNHTSIENLVEQVEHI